MIGRTRWHFRSVDSTQDVAFQLAAMGADHGTIVRAGYQSAGRGRHGRTWQVPADTALMFSVLLRPDHAVHLLGSLSIQVASVLCDVIEETLNEPVQIKWPNDVLVLGGKLGGILMQTRAMPELVTILGVGINIDPPLDALPVTATSLSSAADREIDHEPLYDNILRSLDVMWTQWQPDLPAARIEAIDQRLWLNNEQVTLLDADREIVGFIKGVAPSGGLRLIVDGQEQIVHAGEITRGPRPIRFA